MTKTELRVLSLLSNNGGNLKMTTIATQMSRYTSEERGLALESLAKLDLVHSVEKPRGGAGFSATVYGLTSIGIRYCEQLRTEGKIREKKRMKPRVPPSASGRPSGKSPKGGKGKKR